MSDALLLSAPALAALPLFLILHLLLWQVLPQARKGVFFLVLCAGVAYIACAIANAVFGGAAFTEHIWVSAPLMAFETVAYMHLYFGFDRSLSVRMLGELVESGEGTLPLHELQRRYSVEDMVERRMAVLVDKGLVKFDEYAFACTGKGQRVVYWAQCAARLYGLKATG